MTGQVSRRALLGGLAALGAGAAVRSADPAAAGGGRRVQSLHSRRSATDRTLPS